MTPEPQRTCVGCSRVASQQELSRLAVGPTGEVDLGRNVPGRGAWICRSSVACLEKAVRKGALSKALRVKLDEQALSRLSLQISAKSEAMSTGAGSLDSARAGQPERTPAGEQARERSEK